MDAVEKLLSDYRTEKPSTADGREYAGKIRIIQALGASNDAKALPFLLDVLADQHEYDLARIEVIELLSVNEYPGSEDEEIGHILLEIVKHEPNSVVCEHAAIALGLYTDTPGVYEEFQRIVLNEDASVNIRSAAFESFYRTGPSEHTIRVMRSLVNDELLGDAARKMLQEWGTS